MLQCQDQEICTSRTKLGSMVTVAAANVLFIDLCCDTFFGPVSVLNTNYKGNMLKTNACLIIGLCLKMTLKAVRFSVW